MQFFKTSDPDLLLHTQSSIQLSKLLTDEFYRKLEFPFVRYERIRSSCVGYRQRCDVLAIVSRRVRR